MRRRGSGPVVGVRGVVPVLVLVLTLAGCGARPGPSDASGGLLSSVADLRGAGYVVAGGETDELTILCQVAVAALQAAGAEAQEQCGKIGSVDVRATAGSSEVDTGWTYVARADRNLDDRPDPPTSFAELARADAPEGITWLEPSAFADTDAVVVDASTAAAGVRTLSDLAARAAADPGSVILCGTPEAARDPQRLAGLLGVYGFPAGTPVRAIDAGAVFSDVAVGGCTAGEVPGTSGRIPALGLVALADDRGGFGRSVDGRPASGRGGAAPVMRTSVFARHPQAAAVMAQVTRRLTDDTVRELNRQVTQDGRDPRDVARRWLQAQDLIARG